MAKPKITDSLTTIEELIVEWGMEAALRQIAGGEGSLNFNMSISPNNTSYSFSSTGNGETESYTKSTPYQSPIPEDNPSA